VWKPSLDYNFHVVKYALNGSFGCSHYSYKSYVKPKLIAVSLLYIVGIMDHCQHEIDIHLNPHSSSKGLILHDMSLDLYNRKLIVLAILGENVNSVLI
jgi:hypothetical protein